VGDATITVSIQRDDESVAIRADQTAGATPLTLILEPTIQAPVAACFVDDTPADLAVRPSARHVVVPVQLALDAPRELRIALGPRSAKKTAPGHGWPGGGSIRRVQRSARDHPAVSDQQLTQVRGPLRYGCLQDGACVRDSFVVT